MAGILIKVEACFICITDVKKSKVVHRTSASKNPGPWDGQYGREIQSAQ